VLSVQFGLDGIAGLALALAAVIATSALVERRRAAAALRATGAALAAREADLARERELGTKQGELIAAASHELRNPLTSLVMSAEVLSEEAALTGNEDLAETAETVLRQSRRAARLITEMLDYARIEAGGLQIARDEVDLSQAAADAVQDVRDEAPDLDIQLETGTDCGIVEGDRARLDMVLRNLLQNAVRHADPPLRVRVESRPKAVLVHVEDSGPGIAAPERERIFERFRRGSRAAPAGTGLGLFISRGVMAAHGGTLEVHDSGLGGSDFTMSLPKEGNHSGP
jgi:signal transduction histidine kinase